MAILALPRTRVAVPSVCRTDRCRGYRFAMGRRILRRRDRRCGGRRAAPENRARGWL